MDRQGISNSKLLKKLLLIIELLCYMWEYFYKGESIVNITELICYLLFTNKMLKAVETHTYYG